MTQVYWMDPKADTQSLHVHVFGLWEDTRVSPEEKTCKNQVLLCCDSTGHLSTHRCARPALRTAEEMALMAVSMALMSWVSSPVAPLACRPVSMTKRVRVHTSVSKADWSDMLGCVLLLSLLQRCGSGWGPGWAESEEAHLQPSPFHTQSHDGKPGELFVSAAEWKREGACVSVCIWRWVRGCRVSAAARHWQQFNPAQEKHFNSLSGEVCNMCDSRNFTQ